MSEARNYNAYLVQEVSNAMGKRRRILDFGAGLGTFAIELRARGYEIVCVEPDISLRSELLKMGFETHASLEGVPPKDVDGIYTLNVLEHIPDDGATLRSLYERLKPGGCLYGYVPAFQALYSSMDRRVGHVRRYRAGELAHKCRLAGFAVERTGYADSVGFLATIAYKLFGPRDGQIPVRKLIFYDTYVFPVGRYLDRGLGRLLGKNTWVIASRESEPEQPMQIIC